MLFSRSVKLGLSDRTERILLLCFDEMEKYYHSIQDYYKFIDAVIDLIVDYLKYSNGTDAEDGVFVDDDNVSLISVKDAPDASNFHSIVNLLDLSEDVPKVNYDAVEELTNQYIFVR